MFFWRNKQNYPLIITKYPHYLFHWTLEKLQTKSQISDLNDWLHMHTYRFTQPPFDAAQMVAWSSISSMFILLPISKLMMRAPVCH